MSILSDYARDRFPEVAAKAPDDATLEAYIRDRFPEIAAKADASPQQRTGPPGPMGKYGGLPGDQANLEPTMGESLAAGIENLGVGLNNAKFAGMAKVMNEPVPVTGTGASIGGFAGDTMIGAGKGVIGTSADIAGLLPGVDVSPDLMAATAPENTAQMIGQTGERIAEFVVPGGAVSRGVASFSKAKNLGTAGRVGLEALGQGGLAAGIDLLHGEDLATAKQDAAIAAAFPIAGKAVEKMMKGVSDSGVDKFFKQVSGEKKRGFGSSVAQTMRDEGVTGMRAQTLKEGVESKITTLKTEIADDVARVNGSTPSVSVSGQIDGKLDIAIKRAKLANSEQAGRIEGAREAIAAKLDELSGGTGQLDASGLNGLREHIGEMLKESGVGRYNDELKSIYGYTKDLLSTNVPGVGEKLSRTSNLINTSKRISQKIEELNNKRSSVWDATLGTITAVASGPLQATAGAVLGMKQGVRAFQYTPGRMALAGAQRGMGTLAGAVGAAAPGLAMGIENTPSVTSRQPPMEQQQTMPPAPITSTPMGGAVGKFQPQIEAAAQNANVDPLLLAALVSAESGGNPNARSNKGAFGLTQVTPIALKELGLTKEDVATPEGQLLAGAKYLRLMLDQFNGNVTLALAAYNAGPGAVTRHKGIPPFKETQNYVPRVLRYYDALGGAEGAAVGGL